MKKMGMITALIICFVLLFSLSACLTPGGRTAGQTVDDATITTKVKAKLIKDDILKGFAIGVKTFKSEVTLTGAVDSADTKTRAAQIARTVYGVRKVNNLIKLK
ncbi:MAG: BON domain-containing protein [Deltaproteobacteria bacterium]|nr:BON domain-containing protein [Deltaproteobacteria bacterium]MBW2053068.1 BON domain-containing protein [Deltaproteobacteria bacterium]MBW2140507.1 BON domain-containing protein [Deltaproteobacteria bacterium]